MTNRKTRHGAALAGLVLLLPTMACGQAMPPEARNDSAAGPLKTGLTLQDFTSRREQRVLAADTDGDGKVSRTEFLAAAVKGKRDPARRFARLDRNGDGLVDRQEIASMLARRFGRLDTDRDGVLTAVERSAARAGPTRAAPEE